MHCDIIADKLSVPTSPGVNAARTNWAQILVDRDDCKDKMSDLWMFLYASQPPTVDSLWVDHKDGGFG